MHLLSLLRCLSLTESSLHCVALFDYSTTRVLDSATFLVALMGPTATTSQLAFPFNAIEATIHDDTNITMRNEQSQVDSVAELFLPAHYEALGSWLNWNGESNTERTVYVEPTLPKHHHRAQLDAPPPVHYDTEGAVAREELIDKGIFDNALTEVVPALQRRRSCCICADMYFATAMILCNNCGHSTCVGCFTTYVYFCWRSKFSRPKLCCRSLIPVETLLPYVSPVTLEAYKAKIEEFEDFDPTYCYICSVYLHSGSERSVVCASCGQRTCRRCKQAWEYHRKSNERFPTLCVENQLEQTFLSTSREMGWKCCPYCRNALEKLGGCNYMEYVSWPLNLSFNMLELTMPLLRCPNCFTVFCFVCKTIVIDNVPSTESGRPRQGEPAEKEGHIDQALIAIDPAWIAGEIHRCVGCQSERTDLKYICVSCDAMFCPPCGNRQLDQMSDGSHESIVAVRWIDRTMNARKGPGVATPMFGVPRLAGPEGSVSVDLPALAPPKVYLR